MTTLTRGKLEALVEELVQATLEPCKRGARATPGMQSEARSIR